MNEVVTLFQLSREIVEYTIDHWDNYVINIHYRDTVRLTEKQIVEIICRKHPLFCVAINKKRSSINGFLSNLYTMVIYEFEKHNYKVEKRRLGCKRAALYIHR